MGMSEWMSGTRAQRRLLSVVGAVALAACSLDAVLSDSGDWWVGALGYAGLVLLVGLLVRACVVWWLRVSPVMGVRGYSRRAAFARAALGVVIVCSAGVVGGQALASGSVRPRVSSRPLVMRAWPSSARTDGAREARLLAHQRREQLRRLEAHRRFLASPRARRARRRSRFAFHGISSPAARRLLLRDYAAVLSAAASNPAASIGGHIARVLDSNRVWLRTARGRVLRISTVPLVTSVDGHEQPVDLRLRSDSSGFSPAASAISLSISRDLAHGVDVGSLGLRVVFEGSPSTGVPVAGREVVYSRVASDTDLAVVPMVTGAELFSVLRSRLSPQQLRFRVDLAPGERLQASDGGARVLRDGAVVASIPAPVASDAQGQDVPVSLSVVGNELVLDVAHRTRDLAYPLLVDPAITGNHPMLGWTFHRQGIGPFTGPVSGEIDAPPGNYGSAEAYYSNPGGDIGWWQWSTGTGGYSGYIIKQLTLANFTYKNTNHIGLEMQASCSPVVLPYGNNYPLFTDSGYYSSPVTHTLTSACADTVEIAGEPSSFQPVTTTDYESVSVGQLTLDLAGHGQQLEETFGLRNAAEPYVRHLHCAHPVDCETGNQTERQTDLSVGGLGGGLALTRTYNSMAAAFATGPGPFGYGWSSTYSDHLVIDTAAHTATVYQADGSAVPFAINGDGSISPDSARIQATLVKNPDGTYLYTLPDRRTFMFSSAGTLRSQADRNGNQTSISYDGSGNVVQITDASGRSITLAHNPDGTVSSATDPAGHVVSYAYNNGNLVSVTGVRGGTWQLAYDGQHQLTSQTDPNGGTITTTYDSSNRVVSQTDALGRAWSWTYGPGETLITNPNGAITDEQFTALDEPTSITAAKGTSAQMTTTTSYDTNGNPVSDTDGNAHTTTYSYDAAGNRTSQTDPLGHTTSWTYDAQRDLTSTTTPLGHTTTIAYDMRGNPTSISRTLTETGQTQTTSYTYDALGELTAVTDPVNHTSTLAYDPQGDLISKRTPNGHTTTWSYDADSRIASTTTANGNQTGADPAAYTTTYTRDAGGNPTLITDPRGHTSLSYDANGNLLSTTDPDGRTVTTTYDADNEPTKTTLGDGSTRQTAYDASGQIISQTDGNNQVTTYTRDLLGHVTAKTDPLNRTTSYGHDNAGNRTALTDPSGRTSTYSFDAANRLTKIHYSSGTPADITYTYDADGNRLAMSDQTGTSTRTYDSLDRLTSSTNGLGQTTTYTYDLANQLTQLGYPKGLAPWVSPATPVSAGGGGTVTRTFDSDGNMTAIADPAGNTTHFGYDAQGNITGIQRPDGSNATYSYDANNAITAISDQGAAGLSLSATYTRTPAELLASETDAINTTPTTSNSYSYDNVGRLQTVSYPGTQLPSSTYAYDGAGNITNMAAAPSNITQTYDAGSELTSQTNPQQTYTYDPQGNRTSQSSPQQTYTYDQANELTAYSGAQTAQYIYDGEGNRTDHTVNNIHDAQAYDLADGLPLLLLDGSTSYVYDPNGLPLEQILPTGTVRYYHHDQLGSTRAITDSTGAILATYSYDPYGNTQIYDSLGNPTTPARSIPNPFLYTGQYTDSETGFQYLRARYYDPHSGQLVTRDPLEALTNADYAYAQDDPLNVIDPSGLCGNEASGASLRGGPHAYRTGGKGKLGPCTFSIGVMSSSADAYETMTFTIKYSCRVPVRVDAISYAVYQGISGFEYGTYSASQEEERPPLRGGVFQQTVVALDGIPGLRLPVVDIGISWGRRSADGTYFIGDPI
jgi:RHS repeat-associated protein